MDFREVGINHQNKIIKEVLIIGNGHDNKIKVILIVVMDIINLLVHQSSMYILNINIILKPEKSQLINLSHNSRHIQMNLMNHP